MESSKTDALQVFWQIENFDLIAGLNSLKVWSPVIPTKKFLEFDFYLAISHSTSRKHIYISLNKFTKDEGPTKSPLDVEFSLINKNGHEQLKKTCDFGNDHRRRNIRLPFLNRQVVFENKDEFIPNGVLTLVCRFRLGFPGMKTYIHTEILMERSVFLWKIRNPCLDFSKRIIYVEFDLIEGGFVLECESLKVDVKIENKNFLTFVIRRHILRRYKIAMSVSIQLCNQGNAFSKIEGIYNFNYGKNEWYLGSLDISDLTQNLHKVDLSCQFSISKGNFKSDVKEVFFPVKFQSEVSTLKDDIRAVYEQTIQKISPMCRLLHHTDIVLYTPNYQKAIPAHKMILTARSPVINEIFNHYVEKERNWFRDTKCIKPIVQCKVSAGNEKFKVYRDRAQEKILVYNMSSLTLSQMVQCMYTDTVDITNMDDAILLYMAGKNFEFNLLMSKSRDYLRTRVSMETLRHLLTFAYQVEDVWIKNDFLNFIDKNRLLVFSSEEWNNSSKSFEDLKLKVLADLESNYRIFN